MRGPIARGTIRTTFVLGLRLLVQAGTLLVVARMFGPHEFGAFAGVAALAVALGTLSTFGTHLMLLREVANEPARCAQVLCYAIPTTLLSGGALLTVYLATCLLALRESGISIAMLLALGITEMWLQPMFGLFATEHLALGRVARSQLLLILPMVLRLVAALAVFLLDLPDPVTAYAYGYFAASVIALGTATAVMPSRWPTPSAWHLPTITQLRETAGYAVMSVTSTGPAELDKTLATRLLPLASAGVYAVGTRVIGAATLPVIALMLSALPRLFREGRHQPLRTSNLLLRIFCASLAYGTILAIVLWLTAPAFSSLFGTAYHDIDHMIRWLSFVVPGMALRMAAGNVLLALSRPWIRVTFEVAGLAVLLIASLIFTVRLGAGGMVLALACSEWGMAVAGLVFVSRMKLRRLKF